MKETDWIYWWMRRLSFNAFDAWCRSLDWSCLPLQERLEFHLVWLLQRMSDELDI